MIFLILLILDEFRETSVRFSLGCALKLTNLYVFPRVRPVVVCVPKLSPEVLRLFPLLMFLWGVVDRKLLDPQLHMRLSTWNFYRNDFINQVEDKFHMQNILVSFQICRYYLYWVFFLNFLAWINFILWHFYFIYKKFP